jgi:hypothetical protein
MKSQENELKLIECLQAIQKELQLLREAVQAANVIATSRDPLHHLPETPPGQSSKGPSDFTNTLPLATPPFSSGRSSMGQPANTLPATRQNLNQL